MNTSTSSGEYMSAVTPSDVSNLPNGQPRGIYVGGAGNLSLIDAGGNTILLSAIATGVVHPIAPVRIRSTGTTATGIVAIY